MTSFRRSVIFNTAIILASFAAFGAVFYLFAQGLAAKADQIQADRTAIAKRAADLESLSNLKANASQAEEIEKKLMALLPPQDSLITFPQYLNTLARNYGLDVSFNFSSAPVEPVGREPGYAPFSLTIDGSAEGVRGLINDLERNTTRFMVAFQDLSFVPQGGAYRADLRGQVFFQANAETISP